MSMQTRRQASAARGAPAAPLPLGCELQVVSAVLASLQAPDKMEYALYPHRSSFAWLSASLRRVCKAWRDAADTHPAFVRRARLERLQGLVYANAALHTAGSRSQEWRRIRGVCTRRLAGPVSLPFLADVDANGSGVAGGGGGSGGSQDAAAAPHPPPRRAVPAAVVRRRTEGELRGLPQSALLLAVPAGALRSSELSELLGDLALLDERCAAPLVLKLTAPCSPDPAAPAGNGGGGADGAGSGAGAAGSGGGSGSVCGGTGGSGGSGGGGSSDAGGDEAAVGGGGLVLEAAAALYRSRPALVAVINMEGAPVAGVLYFIPTKHGFRRRAPPPGAPAPGAAPPPQQA